MKKGQIKNFIMKETSQKNESQKMTIIIRMQTMILVAFSLVMLIFTSFNCFSVWGLVMNLAFAFIWGGVFAATYFFSRKNSIVMYFCTMLFWILHNVILFGWNVEIQVFLILLLVCLYFSSYGKYKMKFCISILLFGGYLLLYLCLGHAQPLVCICGACELIVKSGIIISFLICLSITLYFFSKDSQYLENKLIEYNRKLKEQANTDSLTGLSNRRKAMEYLEHQVGKTNMQFGFSICICDIDFFKKVNDQYGHDFGDEVLKQLATLLLRTAKDQYFVARWGGEEFLIVFPNFNGDDAYMLLSKIKTEVCNMRISKGEIETQITMTFGLTEYDTNRGLDYSIKEADNKLYLGKKQGRNIIIY